MTFGAIITGLLYAGAMRFSAWPLMPVGYLLSSTWMLKTIWFSIFLGWLAKVVILRYGGATLFNAARPLFYSLIFGESLAAATWMLITLILAQGDYNDKVPNFLPG